MSVDPEWGTPQDVECPTCGDSGSDGQGGVTGPPDTYFRLRAACSSTAPSIDPDEVATRITEVVSLVKLNAIRKQQAP